MLALALAACVAAAPRPNVLFVFSDDQRCDTLGAWGNPLAKTPNLDALAQRGTRFRRAYCMGAMQGAVCVPSRAMMLSGRSLFRIQEQLKDIPTWPEAFGAAGYDTFVAGKWHNGQTSLTRAFQRGESVFLGGMVNPLQAPVVDLASGTVGPKRHTAGHCVAEYAARAAAFIKDRPADRPWLCYLPFNAPHDPCIVPDDFPVRFDPAAVPLPKNFLPAHPFDNGELDIRDEKLLPRPRDPADLRAELARYHRAVAYMDAQVGVVLRTLEATGQLDRTIVVFASDHGLAKGSHGLLGKQNLYEHSMRTPLIVAGPGIAKGAASDALCYLFDVFPTVGELAGVPAPTGSEGRSLAPQLRNAAAPGRAEVFTVYRHVQRALCEPRWKLMEYAVAGQRRTQLFDLAADPEEMSDLAGNPAHAGELARLRQRLAAAHTEFAAPALGAAPSAGAGKGKGKGKKKAAE